MQNRNIDVAVGLFVLAGFIALLLLALKVGNLGTERKEQAYNVSVQFSNIGGLKPQAPVKAAGVLVGRVKAINFDTQSYQAEVKLELFSRIPFPRDTSASILTAGLLGEVYIGLEPGADVANLKDGDKIKIAQSAVVLEKLIGQFLFNKASEGPAAAASSNGVNSPAAAPAGAATVK